MDAKRLALLEALKVGAQTGGETRLYKRGKFAGLFARNHADAVQEAIDQQLIEVTRVETEGKNETEWVRVTPKGLTFLLDSESPTRVLEELRAALAVNQEGLPVWAADMRKRVEELTMQLTAEVTAMRERLDQMATQVYAALARLESIKNDAALPNVPWGVEAVDYLERREQVGLGVRCPLADLYTSLKEKHGHLSIREFHAGLKQLAAASVIELLPGSNNADAPGPEYALLEGATVHYYVTRARSE